MICDECFEKEAAAQERDEQIAEYHNEQHYIRYKDIHLFDNEVGTISVVYHRKVLRTWNYRVFSYLDEHYRKAVMLEAKGYIEGWLDAVAVVVGMPR
jgi:hypothetical protein